MRFPLFLVFLFINFNIHSKPPELLLAKTYQHEINLSDYWVSEKLDGVRAYWNGEILVSRQGHTFNAPTWFTQPLPNTALDGELWIERQRFDAVSGLVRRKGNDPLNWLRIKYMIFDLPNNQHTFDQRIYDMKAIVLKADAPHIKVIPQFKLSTHIELMQKLDNITEQGGEGLMLHLGSSYYKSGRSNDLLKLKKYLDAEAMVIKLIQGQGKYRNLLGAILVETEEGIQFKIGTGFSDEERANPPAIGDLVTYKYFGLTSKGKPRFASFMRIRKEAD